MGRALLSSWLPIASVIFSSACMMSHGQASPPETAPAARSAPCPVEVPGTQVAASDTPDGAAITFTTSTGDVAELRRRVQAMAEMHNAHLSSMEGGGMMHGGMMHGGMEGETGEGAMAMPVARAAATDVPEGATLTFTAADAAQIELLRARVREHAEMMRAGRCPMTGTGGHAH